MQAFNQPKGRTESGIDSTVAAKAGPEGQGLGLGQAGEKVGDNPVKVGVGKTIKGFAGGLINPKV